MLTRDVPETWTSPLDIVDIAFFIALSTCFCIRLSYGVHSSSPSWCSTPLRGFSSGTVGWSGAGGQGAWGLAQWKYLQCGQVLREPWGESETKSHQECGMHCGDKTLLDDTLQQNSITTVPLCLVWGACSGHRRTHNGESDREWRQE